jgi:hypothetical protein
MTTIEKLLKLWPEIKELLLAEEQIINMPALATVELNKMIGLNNEE